MVSDDFTGFYSFFYWFLFVCFFLDFTGFSSVSSFEPAYRYRRSRSIARFVVVVVGFFFPQLPFRLPFDRAVNAAVNESPVVSDGPPVR